MQLVNMHFRLSANHADEQVMSHFWAKEQHAFCSQCSLMINYTENVQISDVHMSKT